MRKLVCLIGILISVEASSQIWDSLSSGLNRPPRVAFSDSVFNKLYVGGTFTSAGGQEIYGIAAWNGSLWDSLGSGIENYSGAPFPPREPWAITRYGTYLYVSGGFGNAGNIFANAIVRWDGIAWDSVPGANFPFATVVSNMVVHNNELYICGTFDSVGNVPANSIAKWDGVTWSAIGPNYHFDTLASTISTMEFYHGNLYVGGNFYDSTGVLCRFAKWDGSNWEFLCTEMQGGMAGIFDMTVFNDELIVGGRFYQADGHPGNAIKKWNDTVWTDVGGSVQLVSPNPAVTDMTVHNGKLYCAGTFQMIGGVDARGLAVWDGNNWCSFGSDFEYTPLQQTGVQFVNFLNDTMIVGGAFRLVNGDSCIRVAQWIGGNYVDTCGNATVIYEDQIIPSSVLVFPNPAATEVTFEFMSQGKRIVMVIDQLGQEVWRKESSESSVQFPADKFPNGMYFYLVESDGEMSKSGKFIIQH